MQKPEALPKADNPEALTLQPSLGTTINRTPGARGESFSIMAIPTIPTRVCHRLVPWRTRELKLHLTSWAT
jgi:hypothetical protein